MGKPITLVVGASTNPERYAFKATQMLEQKGHVVREHRTMGSTQTIQRVKGEIQGAADTRQMGTAAIGY